MTNTDPDKNQPRHLESWSPVVDAMRHDRVEPRTKQGNLIDPPDPGTSLTRVFAVLISIVLVAFVVVWQNTSEDLKYKLLLPNQQAPSQLVLKADAPAPGNFGQVDLVGRIFLRARNEMSSYPVLEQIETPGTRFINEDEVRLIMLAGEFVGADQAIDRIRTLRSKIETKANDPDNPIVPDQLIESELTALETIYLIGVDALADDQRDQLSARYGHIGKIALTFGLNDTDPRRAPLITGFVPLVLLGLLAFLVALLGPLLGLIALVFGIVYLSTGRLKLRSHVAAKGGSIFLETYALFVGGFLVMSIGGFYAANSGALSWLASNSLLLQWVLLLAVLWGLVRGMRSKEWRHAIGWHCGQGVLKEIGCGIVAYLASLPIYIIGVIITVILLISKDLILTSMNKGVPPDPVAITNPVFEMIAYSSWRTILLLFILATTWAPIVEEAIFRGALFRHLRSSMHWVVAGLISATLFAFMHDYGPLMVAPLIALGFMFAFMREWRGSLIAPMTAHFLHNFSLMVFMILLVQTIKDPY